MVRAMTGTGIARLTIEGKMQTPALRKSLRRTIVGPEEAVIIVEGRDHSTTERFMFPEPDLAPRCGCYAIFAIRCTRASMTDSERIRGLSID
jgi:hypothetical protein